MRPAGHNKRVSIVDVARKAGVSQATASRVFDSKWEGKIRPQTRAAVEEAAKALGYYGTSALVRGLQGNSSGIVALVVGSTTGYFYLEVIMKFVRQLRAAGRQVLIFEADPAQDIATIVSQVHSYRVDAVIITAAATSSVIIDQFCQTDIPVVVFNRPVETDICSAVYCDGASASAMAADFLLEHGHRRFAVISGDANVSKELGRIEGFCSRVRQRGGEVLEVVDGDYLYESGYDIARALLARQRPDAVFCAEDTIAMGVIDAARECFGLRVPEDLSVMGFDNTSVSRFHAYGLTTVEHPVGEMIKSVIKIMERMIEAPQLRVKQVCEMKLVVRKSVRL